MPQVNPGFITTISLLSLRYLSLIPPLSLSYPSVIPLFYVLF